MQLLNQKKNERINCFLKVDGFAFLNSNTIKTLKINKRGGGGPNNVRGGGGKKSKLISGGGRLFGIPEYCNSLLTRFLRHKFLN